MATAVPDHPGAHHENAVDLLRDVLEEQFVTHTNQLTVLTVYGRLPGRGGYDRETLHTLTEAARQGVADTAQALRRVSEGTYGTCEECGGDISLGRLRALPHARLCAPCEQRRTR